MTYCLNLTIGSISGSLIGSQIYRKWDAPYYKTGNTVCISILSLAIVAILAQRQWLVRLNRKKQREWERKSQSEQISYQMDKAAREQEGNKRLDFRFAY